MVDGRRRRRHARGVRTARWLADSVSRYVRRAPGTHIYLLVLLVTTAVVRSLHPVVATALLRQVSTNLTQMGRASGRVLLLSAFLLSGGRWVTEAVLFTAVYVPLERWVGTLRWLVIVAASHVTATLVTTVGIWADVRSHRGGLVLTDTIDVGVSYGFFGAVGFLFFRLRSWRTRTMYGLAAACPLVYGMVRYHTFTDAGHLAAVLIGGTLYALLGPGVRRRGLRSTLASSSWSERSPGTAPQP